MFETMNFLFEYKGWHFEWDSEKEAPNIQAHPGINFERAAIFFRDRRICNPSASFCGGAFLSSSASAFGSSE